MRTIMLTFLLLTGFGVCGCVVREERPRPRTVYVERERVWIPEHRREDGVIIQGYYVER